MASLITCPHCGERPKEEFTIRGDATVTQPSPEADGEVWHAYVHLRENPRGLHKEYWHHTSGCRRWLVVTRDTVSHDVIDVSDAGAAA
ncbi:sarcosine oxidase subunit delta [Roseibium polysiphoniae]|uniref:Sarcosine oxidase subunit delta n=1 Tax=Roseibium polysiphoniae TaxID=2571221 RepID=A0A944GSX5_9HYPH|nr:sarcosine oxidase subunit delta [Roseibium polysiphoniae]MBS8260632.1 sarcosine oxidase subunit delta [Roseibium polysiphoniae]